MNTRPALRPTRQLVLAAITTACFGGTSLAQTPRMPGMPTTAAPSSPRPAVSGALGGIQYSLGGLAQPQAPALGTLTVCPVTDIGGAAGTAGLPASGAGSGLSPIVTSPAVTPQMVAPSVSVPQYLIAPIGTSQLGLPQTTPQVVSPGIGPSSGVAPPVTVPVTPNATSLFGMSTVTGTCSPMTLGEPATPPAPSTAIGGATYSDAAIPVDATETGGSGLSPLVEVPAPALFSAGGAPTGP